MNIIYFEIQDVAGVEIKLGNSLVVFSIDNGVFLNVNGQLIRASLECIDKIQRDLNERYSDLDFVSSKDWNRLIFYLSCL